MISESYKRIRLSYKHVSSRIAAFSSKVRANEAERITHGTLSGSRNGRIVLMRTYPVFTVSSAVLFNAFYFSRTHLHVFIQERSDPELIRCISIDAWTALT